ncbi:hypothetical protein, partial [Streptomyces rochei]|uniref:hypothetical protein n=1 Tax=Streptomyces rochei TaxID=1928 RepID=UPI0033AF0E6D
MGRPTLFHVELKRRGWDDWEEFCIHFSAAARTLADLTGRRRLATASPRHGPALRREPARSPPER